MCGHYVCLRKILRIPSDSKFEIIVWKFRRKLNEVPLNPTLPARHKHTHTHFLLPSVNFLTFTYDIYKKVGLYVYRFH